VPENCFWGEEATRDEEQPYSSRTLTPKIARNSPAPGGAERLRGVAQSDQLGTGGYADSNSVCVARRCAIRSARYRGVRRFEFGLRCAALRNPLRNPISRALTSF